MGDRLALNEDEGLGREAVAGAALEGFGGPYPSQAGPGGADEAGVAGAGQGGGGYLPNT